MNISFSAFAEDNLLVHIGTFLGNEHRNYYGNRAPESLDVIWKHYLGKGITVISRKIGEKEWEGAGWTGQPLLFESDSLYLIQGAYDHHLKKINAETGSLVWQYEFDDVIKGTGTIWKHPNAKKKVHEYLILQGSRLGVGNYLDSKHIPSYRAVSLIDGSETWRLDVKWTDSYSRDADGSAVIYKDLAYIGLENSLLTVLDPRPEMTSIKDHMLQPKILEEHQLYAKTDLAVHKGNVVTESSPAILGDHLYVSSGAGHVYGYNLKTRKLDWDFIVGSDMDGSVVVTNDSCILVSVEKQYIKGKGGVLKLDPSKKPEDAVVWFFPTEDHDYFGWEGGVIGSPAVSDFYPIKSKKNLAAFVGLDGWLNVVYHQQVLDSTVLGFDSVAIYNPPVLFDRYKTGPSISTPLIVHDKIVAATYKGIYLFSIGEEKIDLIDHFPFEYESTPIVHDGRLYVASRNGYLYCFGDHEP